MTYTIEIYTEEHGNKEYPLKGYSFSVADEIEKIKKTKYENLVAKCKAYYKFLNDVLGAENVKETIGEFNSADPNDIQILYREVVNVYTKPTLDANVKEAEGHLASVEHMLPVIEKLSQMKK